MFHVWQRFATIQLSKTRGIATLKQHLKTVIKDKRLELKSLKEKYGRGVLGTVTLEQCIDGGNHIPVIFSQHSYEEGRSKLIDDFYNTSSEHTARYLFEAFVWYLLTRQHPTQSELEEFVQLLQTRKYHLPSSSIQTLNTILPSLPKTFHHTRLFSIAILCLQPGSKFFQHRRETVKIQHWELILEDILDIISIFPEVIKLIHSHVQLPIEKTFSLQYLPSQPSYVEVLDSITHGREKDSSVLKFIENMISDGGQPLVHTMRLVNCTLSDPYLATSSAVQAFDENERHDMFVDGRYYRLTAGLIGALIELFWDRALMLPLENPKSVNWEFLHQQLNIPVPTIFGQKPRSDDNVVEV